MLASYSLECKLISDSNSSSRSGSGRSEVRLLSLGLNGMHVVVVRTALGWDGMGDNGLHNFS